MIRKPDALTEAELAEALETIQIILDSRQDAKTLPLVLRGLAAYRDMAWLARATGWNSANKTLHGRSRVVRNLHLMSA